MLKRLILIGIVSIVSFGAVCHRQLDQDSKFSSIKGKVRDSATGEPVIGVTVAIKGTKMGAQTDPSGRYRIARIPPGDYIVICTSVGYYAVEIPDVRLSEGVTRTLDVKLKLFPNVYPSTLHLDNTRPTQ